MSLVAMFCLVIFLYLGPVIGFILGIEGWIASGIALCGAWFFAVVSIIFFGRSNGSRP